MPAKESSPASAVHRLKQEIDRLTHQQTEARKTATFIGMTEEEAEHYDRRRQEIASLLQELAALEKAQ
jgi:hypothetical protein